MVPTVSWPTHLRRVKLFTLGIYSIYSSPFHLLFQGLFFKMVMRLNPNHTANRCQSDPPNFGVRKTPPIPQLSVILKFHPVLSTFGIRKVPQHMQFLQDLQSLFLLIAEDEVLPTCQGKWDQTILVFFSGQFRSRKKTKCNNADTNSPKNRMLLGDLPHVNHHISGRVLTPSDNPS